jgi:PAS domain S-box-containing protein
MVRHSNFNDAPRDNGVMEKMKVSYSLLDRISDAVIVINIKGDIKYVNSSAEKMLGYYAKETAGLNAYDIISIESETNSIELERYLQDATLPRSKFFLKNRRGESIPVSLTASSNPEHKEGDEEIIVIIRDETSQYVVEQQLEESVNNLRKAIKGVVCAMENTIEQRDPYTAGHQRRVSTLSRQIGQMMGLTPGMIEGIRLAGMLHDIGKISIPAEILSKPCSLISAEFDLIKTHPQRGRDILKTIDFPWPLAEIVHQHHERINGSGYPQGLAGDEIRIEARIIAVADVVEAMVSHRPYRAAVGVDAAIQEIESKKGNYYDRDAVGSCVELMKNRNDGMVFNVNPFLTIP